MKCDVCGADVYTVWINRSGQKVCQDCRDENCEGCDRDCCKKDTK